MTDYSEIITVKIYISVQCKDLDECQHECLLFLMISSYSYDDCKATADWLLAQTDIQPRVGIVCGSGLGGLAEMLKDQVAFNYKDIPNFPQSTGE